MEQDLDGGCLCGAVRYRVSGPFAASGICHCRMCRKTASVPPLPFVTLPQAAFAITRGQPTYYRSSEHVVRSFCGRCGPPLIYRNDRKPQLVDIMTCSLDDPDRVPPTFHVWTRAKSAWSAIGDTLPAFDTPPMI